MTNPDPLQDASNPITPIPVLTEDFVRRSMATVKGAAREAWRTQCKLRALVLWGEHQTRNTGDRRTPIQVQIILQLRDVIESLPPGEEDGKVRALKMMSDIIAGQVSATRELNGKALALMTEMMKMKHRRKGLGHDGGEPSDAELEAVASGSGSGGGE